MAIREFRVANELVDWGFSRLSGNADTHHMRTDRATDKSRETALRSHAEARVWNVEFDNDMLPAVQ